MIDLNMKQRKILGELEESKLSNFVGFKLEKLLFNKIGKAMSFSVHQALLEVGKRLICNFFEISGTIDGKDILLISFDYARNDHNKAWSKFKNLFDEYDEITIKEVRIKKSNLIGLSEVFRSIAKWCVYYSQLKKITSKMVRAVSASYLIELFRLKNELESYNVDSLIMAQFFDGNPYENLITQEMQLKGITTVVLQHGQPVFHGFYMDYLNQSAILNFSSNYIALPGEFARKQFVKANVPEEKLVVVGSLREILPLKSNMSKYFTVFLDCPTLPNAKRDNLKLIYLAENYAKKHEYKYYIKCHPQDEISNYQKLSSSKGKFYLKDISIEESLENVEFAVLHASSVYLDILAIGIKAFCLITETNFPLVEYKLDSFDDVQMLEDKIAEWNNMNNLEKHQYFTQVISYYLSPENATKRNHDFIMSLIRN